MDLFEERVYFDAVIDEAWHVLFNGTPEETKKWLEENDPDCAVKVCLGTSLALVTPQEYMRR